MLQHLPAFLSPIQFSSLAHTPLLKGPCGTSIKTQWPKNYFSLRQPSRVTSRPAGSSPQSGLFFYRVSFWEPSTSRVHSGRATLPSCLRLLTPGQVEVLYEVRATCGLNCTTFYFSLSVSFPHSCVTHLLCRHWMTVCQSIWLSVCVFQKGSDTFKIA